MAFTETLTADGKTGDFTAYDDFQMHIKGTFGGGTITVEQEISGTFELVTETEVTSDSDKIFEVVQAGVYRFDLSGSTTPSITITALGSLKTN